MLQKIGAEEGDDRGPDAWMHHRSSGFEFEQSPGDGEGQEGMIYCSPWDYEELEMTE